jgi:hypothetical protein
VSKGSSKRERNVTHVGKERCGLDERLETDLRERDLGRAREVYWIALLQRVDGNAPVRFSILSGCFQWKHAAIRGNSHMLD